jgi:thermostable 8-oxoguanine DNA glycosylase
MIDPSNITNYNLTTPQLQETILWWILAAGKNGVTAARCLDSFLSSWSLEKEEPFEVVRKVDFYYNLPLEMKSHGIGCYNNKARSWRCLVNSGINLKECSLEELESIVGIGPKTARCFLIHSRKNQNYAGLDTHLLKFLRLVGYNAPKSTPPKKSYAYLEKEFLNLVKKSKKTVAEFDLVIWNYYSKNSSSLTSKEDMLKLLESIGAEVSI